MLLIGHWKRSLAALAVGFLCSALYAGGASEAGKGSASVVFIPKLVGIPWFNAMEKGLRETAASLGGMEITVSGAPDTDPAAQARVLEDVIAKRPAAIVVVPNDTKVLEPLLKKARDAGILVVTQEAPSVQNADVDVEFLILEREGKDMVDLLVKHAGRVGGYAIMVGGLTVESHNKRADAMVAYQKRTYPDLYEVTSRVEGAESVQISHDKTLELITAYPDLKGIIYIGSLGGVGGSQALSEQNLKGKIALIGSSVPSQAKKLLEEGSLSADYIGNPYRIGKDTAYIVGHLLKGGTLGTVGKLPEYGDAIVEGKTITFHADVEVTAENADSFGF